MLGSQIIVDQHNHFHLNAHVCCPEVTLWNCLLPLGLQRPWWQVAVVHPLPGGSGGFLLLSHRGRLSCQDSLSAMWLQFQGRIFFLKLRRLTWGACFYVNLGSAMPRNWLRKTVMKRGFTSYDNSYSCKWWSRSHHSETRQPRKMDESLNIRHHLPVSLPLLCLLSPSTLSSSLFLLFLFTLIPHSG